MKPKKYYAFISYKREDEKWAVWLQHKLEHFRLPSNLNGSSDLPKYLRPIFRDVSELSAGVLADELQAALEGSEYLIVICSTNARHSKWINKEVQVFIEMGRADKIIPFIIDGTPNSEDPNTECFPVSLRSLPESRELLGVNIGEVGRDAAAIKVIAHMLGLSFDSLWQRAERDKRRRSLGYVVAATVLTLVALGVSFYISRQNRELRDKNWDLMERQARVMTMRAESLLKEGNSFEAGLIASQICPKNLEKPDIPFVPETERVLRQLYYTPDAMFIDSNCGSIDHVLFSPDDSLLAVASDDACIRLWEVKTGRLLRVLRGHNQRVNRIAFDKSGTRLVSGGNDNAIILWDIPTGEQIYKISEHTNIVTNVAFASSDKNIITSSKDGTTVEWDAITGEKRRVLCQNGGSFAKPLVSPDGRFLVYYNTGELEIMDIVSEQIILTKRVYIRDFIDSFYFANNENILCFKTGKNRDIFFMNIQSGELQSVEDDLSSFIRTPAIYVKRTYSDQFIPDSLFICHADNSRDTLITPDTDYIASACISNNHEMIATGSQNMVARIYSLSKEKHSSQVRLEFIPPTLEFLSQNKTLRETIPAPNPDLFLGDYNDCSNYDSIDDSSFSYDGRHLVTTSMGLNRLTVWSISSGTELYHIDHLNSETYALRGSNPDRDALFSIDIGDGNLYDYLLSKGRFELPINAWHPNGNTFITWREGGVIEERSMDRDSIIREYCCKGEIMSASYAPSGSSLAAINANRVMLWDTLSGDLYMDATLPNDSLYINQQFAISGNRMAVSRRNMKKNNYSIVVLDVPSGEIIQEWDGLVDGYKMLYFIDSNRLGGVSYDGVINEFLIGSPDSPEVWSTEKHGTRGRFFISRSGNYLISFPHKKHAQITVWSTHSRIPLLSIPSDNIHSAGFTNNDKSIIILTEDGIVNTLDFPPLQELITEVHKKYDRTILN